jgi:hypothetical protein
MALATLVSAAPAFAQRVEVSGLVGWTFSDGVDGQAVTTAEGIYDRVDPKDSFKWGFLAGVLVSPNAEVGFQFGQQMTQLEASGTNTREIGDMSINTYHGYFAYNFGEVDAVVRPYVMGGMGATNFSSIDYTRITGESGTIGGETQFSTTWGAGVKVFASPNVGARFGVQWTPTYIKSDPGGWWCDPWWGCYLVGNAQYANQWDLGGGITFRF